MISLDDSSSSILGSLTYPVIKFALAADEKCSKSSLNDERWNDTALQIPPFPDWIDDCPVGGVASRSVITKKRQSGSKRHVGCLKRYIRLC